MSRVDPIEIEDWRTQPERGPLAVMRAAVFIARKLGRTAMGAIIPIASLYFVLTMGEARRASRAYLTRVLGRRPRFVQVLRHFMTFGGVILDRIYLLNDELKRYDVDIKGEEAVLALAREGRGCLLLGAHLGSFEILRAVGRRQDEIRVSLCMFEENAQKISEALAAINPALQLDVIPLGRPDSMAMISGRLERGGFVGLLADRSLTRERQRRCEFLGDEAAFPLGPFRLASMLDVPVVLMYGLYRGKRQYEVIFETVPPFDETATSHVTRSAPLLAHYAERLAHHCRSAPYNWFNFYDFWR